eukprot:m51a1_g492 putative cathepsin b (318) ;mRNA; r:236062-237810
MRRIPLAFLCLCLAAAASAERPALTAGDLWAIKSPRWTASLAAGRSLAALPLSAARRLLGLRGPLPTALPLGAAPGGVSARLPEAFDAREAWAKCPSLAAVRDQGACALLFDRECTVQGRTGVSYSSEDLLACAVACGDCSGGSPMCAHDYWVKDGIVSAQCYPSSVPPCDVLTPTGAPNCSSDLPTPKCWRKCTGDKKIDWAKSKQYGQKVYTVSGETNIMNEVMQNGPCVTAMTVYADFYAYAEGVYDHVFGDAEEGGHVVKIIGWGVDNSTATKYWILANSWGDRWGERGFFRVVRGKNECGIEALAWCGLPKS